MQNLSRDEVKVIHSVFSRYKATRISIAEALDMSLLKISSLLSSLEQKGYIRKKGKQQIKTGRPSHLYILEKDRFYTLGISVDIGYYRILGVDCGKNIIFDRTYEIGQPQDASEYVKVLMDSLEGSIRDIREEFAGEGRDIAAVGAAVTGMVDTKRGVWLLGLQVGGVKNVGIVETMRQRTGLPFYVDDNSRSIAFLEKLTGSGVDLEDFILLYIGKGVGAGLVINNSIYSGYHGVSGEIGHIPQGSNNYRCSCGNIGCLEAIVSPAGIKRVMLDRLREGVVSSLSRYTQMDEKNLTLEIIRKAAEDGDRFAKSTLYELGTAIGEACATLIKLFNPQRIIISGYSSILRDFFKEAIDQKIRHSVILEMLIDYETEFADYGLHQEAYGAGLIAFERYLRDRAAPVRP
ncbi:MAG: ROK family protein [Spirochaetales bacterium]|nr:MAG: ROK family protein [Spirochaetales bacterium]